MHMPTRVGMQAPISIFRSMFTVLLLGGVLCAGAHWRGGEQRALGGGKVSQRSKDGAGKGPGPNAVERRGTLWFPCRGRLL